MAGRARECHSDREGNRAETKWLRKQAIARLRRGSRARAFSARVGRFGMRILLSALLLFFGHGAARAQVISFSPGQNWRYQLTDGAAIMDDCPICDRVSIWEPLQGSFDSVVVQRSPISFAFLLTNINFVSVNTNLPVTRISGSGTLDFDTGRLKLTLDLKIVRSGTTEPIHMTNSPAESPRVYPIIGANVNEDTASQTHVYRLRIQAAPIRELWFSTAINFTSAQIGAISHGDLLTTGRVIKRNFELTESLSVPEGEVGLDAIDIGPRGELFFSTTSNI